MYRDEREALHAQVDKLRAELEEVKLHGDPAMEDRARELHADVARTEKLLAKMRAEALQLEQPRRGLGLFGRVLIAGSIALVGAGALTWLVRRREPPPEVDEPAEAPIDARPPPVEPRPVPEPPALAPALPADSTRELAWNAVVTRATGVAVSAGARCKITATAHRRHASHDFYDDALHVVCGASTTVYSTDMATGGGINAESSRVRELPTLDENAIYTLRRTDSGERPGERPMLDLDTTRGKAVIWRAGLAPLRVELTLDKTSTPAPRTSAPEERIERVGTVQSSKGPGAPKVGAACVARAVFTGQGWECAALVTCGGKALVSPDEATCDHEGFVLGAAHADGPRVRFRFDRAGETLSVSGTAPTSASVEIALTGESPPPASSAAP